MRNLRTRRTLRIKPPPPTPDGYVWMNRTLVPIDEVEMTCAANMACLTRDGVNKEGRKWEGYDMRAEAAGEPPSRPSGRPRAQRADDILKRLK